jgi:BlaI family transcriptional regulator, penicillinase repressor
MARTPQDITETELGILEFLWERDQATIRQITDKLYPKGGNSQYATVQKLLERLENKGYVKRSRGTGPTVFTATTSREELIGRRLQATAERLCGGSLTPLLMHLVRGQKLTAVERKDLRQLIDELDAKNHSSIGRR